MGHKTTIPKKKRNIQAVNRLYKSVGLHIIKIFHNFVRLNSVTDPLK